MKKIILVIGIIVLCFSVNAFSDDWKDGFEKGYLCGRAYQLGRDHGVDGTKMVSRTQRESYPGTIFKYDPSNEAVLPILHESYESGYLDGVNIKGGMIRQKGKSPLNEVPSIKY